MLPSTRRTLVQGLVAGLLGYAAVVLYFLVSNLALGHPPFHTPSLLEARSSGAWVVIPSRRSPRR